MLASLDGYVAGPEAARSCRSPTAHGTDTRRLSGRRHPRGCRMHEMMRIWKSWDDTSSRAEWESISRVPGATRRRSCLRRLCERSAPIRG